MWSQGIVIHSVLIADYDEHLCVSESALNLQTLHPKIRHKVPSKLQHSLIYQKLHMNNDPRYSWEEIIIQYISDSHFSFLCFQSHGVTLSSFR